MSLQDDGSWRIVQDIHTMCSCLTLKLRELKPVKTLNYQLSKMPLSLKPDPTNFNILQQCEVVTILST